MNATTLDPETFFFFRRHKIDEGKDSMPMRMTAKECRSLLFSTHGEPDRLIKKMMDGKPVHTSFGMYWAELKK